MAFDGVTVAALTAEFSQTLTGARVNKIAQPEPDEILLTLKTDQGQKRLLLSANASLPTAHLCAENRISPMTAPNFCMLLRKHIGSARLLSVSQPGLERVICLTFEHLDEMGDVRRKHLYLEIMGKYSNLIFTDEEDRILDAIKRVSATMSSVREVLPGQPYFIPDTRNKKDLLTISDTDLSDLLFGGNRPIMKTIYEKLTGLSSRIAGELCARTQIDPQTKADEVADPDRTKLMAELGHLRDTIRKGEFECTIYEDGNGPVDFSAYPIYSLASTCTKRTLSSPSEMIIDFYATKEDLLRIRRRSAELRQVTSSALERARHKLELQTKQLKDTEDRETWRLRGEMIKTYGYRLKSGMDSFEDLCYETGESMRVPLDPTITPFENAGRCFARYQKAKRTYEAVTERIADSEAEIDYLLSVNHALDIAAAEGDLAQIREELSDAGYVKKTGTKVKSNYAKSTPYHFVLPGDFDLYVGKNNLQNETITFRLAEGNDLWFHAKNVPGSHCVLKCGKREVPDEIYVMAASAAAWFSSARENEKVEVDYLTKKGIKKVAGAKPGFVIYHSNYSIMVTPKEPKN